MPTRPPRPCLQPGCPNLVHEGLFCSEHQPRSEPAPWIRSLILQDNLKAFYNSAAWEHLRQEVLDEQHHECQLCKEKGLYSEAEAVHHIEPVRKRPNLALTKSNLLAVCNQCHYEIHHTRAHRTQLKEERW